MQEYKPIYGDVIDRLFEMKAEIVKLDKKVSQIITEMSNSTMAFKRDYFEKIESEGGEIDYKQINACEEEINKLYMREYDAINDEIIKLKKQINQKINEVENRLNISNKLLASLVSKMQGVKWVIVEGSDVWQNMFKRCLLTGLYAINENNKFFGKTRSQYQKICRAVYNSQATQFDAEINCKAPSDIINSDDLCILAEYALDLPDTFFEEVKSKGITKARIEQAKSKLVLDYQSTFKSINWFKVYLKRKLGLTPSDEIYGGMSTPVDLMDENSTFKNLAYKAIDDYVENLRSNSFVLK